MSGWDFGSTTGCLATAAAAHADAIVVGGFTPDRGGTLALPVLVAAERRGDAPFPAAPQRGAALAYPPVERVDGGRPPLCIMALALACHGGSAPPPRLGGAAVRPWRPSDLASALRKSAAQR